MSTFFRVDEYRAVFRRVLEERGDVKMAAALMGFSASFAKWRYHTIAVVLEELAAIRGFCEGVFSPNLLGSVKDAEELAQVKGDVPRPALLGLGRVHAASLLLVRSFSHVGHGLLVS